VRLFARTFRQLEPGEAAEIVVYQKYIEVLVTLDVCDGVAFARAGLDVSARELQHVADGL
jgi:hypothetical protein